MTHANEQLLTEIAAKIAAMEAMADPDRGATQSEIENATALIQKLLTKHNLSLEGARRLAAGKKKADPDEIVIDRTPYHGARKFEWEELLSHNIARGFFCKVLYDKFGYLFIGTKADARIAIQTFNRVRPLIATMATRATEEYANDWRGKGVFDVRQLKGPYSLKSYKLSYLKGAAIGIGKKLAEQRAADEAAYAGQVTALVVVRDAAIDDRIKSKWSKIGKPKQFDATHNTEGYERGREDGYTVNIYRGELTVED